MVDLVPGSQFRYSGGGYVIMQQAVEDVTGATYPEFIRGRVLQPIGMDNSTYEQPLPASLLDSAGSGYYANGVAVPGSALLRAPRCERWIPRPDGSAPNRRIWCGHPHQQRQRIGTVRRSRTTHRPEGGVARLLVACFSSHR